MATTAEINTAIGVAEGNLKTLQERLRIVSQSLDNINPAYQANQNYIAKLLAQQADLQTQIATTQASVSSLVTERADLERQAPAAPSPTPATPVDNTVAETSPPAEPDPFEASRLAAAAEFNDTPIETEPPPVGDEDPEVAYYQSLQQENEQANARAELLAQEAEPVGLDGFPYYTEPVLNQPGTAVSDGSESGVQEQINVLNAQKQATLQARQNQPSSADWRVRLQLAPGADYLYKAKSAGILQPLAMTDGVVFPYTPSIETSYQAKYNQSDLTHSNYRGYFYQSSYVDHVNIRAVFTAQDTREASYLLAVIHFFRSVTKMFYGKDSQAGSPPPLVYLSGLGQYQFSNHPCVVSNFGYSLPSDVDYIRANGFNNIGIDLLNRNNQSSGPAFNGILGGFLSSKLGINGLSLGGIRKPPSPSVVNQNVNTTNSTNSTYVPTKMEISITLLPIQTRNQVSKQFSLENFANGNLLKGGFW